MGFLVDLVEVIFLSLFVGMVDEVCVFYVEFFECLCVLLGVCFVGIVLIILFSGG